MSITTTTFPLSWKIGQVVPIYKKGNRASFASYRPVTLLPLLSKAMEHIVHQQLKAYLDEQQVLSSAQHGFRSKRSCCPALLTISNNLSAAKNDGRFSAIAALDYTRAFDTINHEILLRKLAAINFDSNSLSWFSSYLSGRQQYISYNGAQSDLLATTHGVLQGSLMGPTLFLIYINDLFNELPSNSAIAYVDDVTRLASGSIVNEATIVLQDLLNVVRNWSFNNCLRLNPAKCVAMCIMPSKRKAGANSSNITSLKIDTSEIAYASSVKILGVVITTDLDWRQQARAVRTKMAAKLSVLRRIGGSLNTRARAHVYKMCIQPQLEYCLPVWACCGSEQDHIDKTLTRAKRVITNCKSATISKDDFKLFRIISFSDLKFLSLVLQYFKCVHSSKNDVSVLLLSQVNKSVMTRASVSKRRV